METAGVQSNPQADQLRQVEKAKQAWQSSQPAIQDSLSEHLRGFWGQRPALSRNPGTFPRIPLERTSSQPREHRNATTIRSFLELLDTHFGAASQPDSAAESLQSPLARPRNFLSEQPLQHSATQTAARAPLPDFTGPTSQRISAADSIPIFLSLTETDPFANSLFPLPSFPTAVISADTSARLGFSKLEFARSLSAKSLTRQYLRIATAGLDDAGHLVSGVKQTTNEFAGHLKPPVEFRQRSGEKAEERESFQRLEQRALNVALAQRADRIFGQPIDPATISAGLPGLPDVQLPGAAFPGFVARNNAGALLVSQSRAAIEDLRQTVADAPSEERVGLLQQVEQSVGRLETTLLRDLLSQFQLAPLTDTQFQNAILPQLVRFLPPGRNAGELQNVAARFFQSPVQTRQDGAFTQDAETLAAGLTFSSDETATLFRQFLSLPTNTTVPAVLDQNVPSPQQAATLPISTAGPAVQPAAVDQNVPLPQQADTLPISTAGQTAAFAAVADTILSTPVGSPVPSVTATGVDLEAAFARSPIETQRALAPDLAAFREFAAASERLAGFAGAEGPVPLPAVRDLEVATQRLTQLETAFQPGGRLATLRDTTSLPELRQFLEGFQTNLAASRTSLDQTSQVLATRPVEFTDLAAPDSIEARFLSLFEGQLPNTSRPIASSSPAITVADLQTALSQLRPETRTILIEGVQAFVEFTAAFSRVTNASEVASVLTLGDLQNQSIANQRLAQLDASFQQSATLFNLRQQSQSTDLQQFLDDLQTRVEANRDLLIETNAANRRLRLDLGQSQFDRASLQERFQDFLTNKAGLEAEAAQRVAARELSDARFVQRRDRADELAASSQREVGETVPPEDLDFEEPDTPREIEPQPDDRLAAPIEEPEQDLRFVDTGVDRRDLEALQRLEQGADLTNQERVAAERAAENILFRLLGQEPVAPIDDTRVQLANLAARNEIPVRFANELASRDLTDPGDREFINDAIELTRQNEPNLAQRLSELYFNGQLQQGFGLTTEAVRVMMDEALQAPYIYKIGDQYRSVMS